MKHTFDIPDRMKHLPLDDRGYPIPYFVPIVDGKPDFRYQDSKKKFVCRKFSKCSICGKPLLKDAFWFVQGPRGMQNCISSDEAMHEECARFSLASCPHLLYKKAERKSDPNAPNATPTILRAKPDIIYLIKANKIYFIDAIHTRFRIAEIYPFEYVNNVLIPA